jgi:hypothetical protein
MKTIFFDRNYHYRYIHPTSKIYTLCQPINKYTKVSSLSDLSLNTVTQKLQFYTIPFMNRIRHEPQNALFGFTTSLQCQSHKEKYLQHEVNIIEYNLEDMKALSSLLNMPLLIQVSLENDHYELFYFEQKHI